MTSRIKLAPPYSIVLVKDPTVKGSIPEYIRNVAIMTTPGCVAIACMPETDGEAEFTLARVQDLHEGQPPRFNGILSTPSHEIVIETVERKQLLRIATSHAETKVQIWLNAEENPDKIVVGIS